MKRRLSIAGAVVAAVLITAGGVAWITGEGHTTVDTADPNGPKSGIVGQELVVELPDKIQGLSPSSDQPFTVVVNNPNAFPVRLNSMSGHNPLQPDGCKDYGIQLRKIPTEQLKTVIIPAGGTHSIDAIITMRDWAVKNCGGKQRLPFDVEIQGSAV